MNAQKFGKFALAVSQCQTKIYKLLRLPNKFVDVPSDLSKSTRKSDVLSDTAWQSKMP